MEQSLMQENHKETYTLVFDGDCGICTASADWVEAHDVHGNVETVPYQLADLEALSPGLTPDMTSRSVYFVEPDGTRYREGRAVFETLKHLSGIYRVLGLMLANPVVAALTWPGYRLVASNRAKISVALGMTACAVPSPGKPGKPSRKNA